MALRLIEKIPLLKNSKMFVKYSKYLQASEFKIDALLWIIISLLFAVIIGFTGWFLMQNILKLTEHSMQIGALLFILSGDLLIGMPYLAAKKRIDQIEEALPDALRQMADTLRAGGTYELALREIATSEYGPLKKEMNEVLRKLEEGDNFENALRTLSYNVDSRLVQRTVTIIIDSVYAGAGLASVLEEISEDVRALHRINKERQARTIMQVIFMFAAGGVVAPLIFGFTSTISNTLINAAAAVASAEEQATAENALETISLSIQAYIFIQALATSLMMSMMREGNAGKSIIYFPVLLFIAYLSYLAAQLISAGFVGAV